MKKRFKIMILISEGFSDLCAGATVYVDTNVFIYAYDNSDLRRLLSDMAGLGVAFVTLSSVEYEFTRGSRGITELRGRREFVRAIAERVLPVGGLLENDGNEAFSVAMSLTVGKSNSQYTDFLIAVAMHKFMSGVERQFVLSADISAFPTDIFSIEGVVSLELKKNSLVHLNLISLDKAKYEAMAQKIASS